MAVQGYDQEVTDASGAAGTLLPGQRYSLLSAQRSAAALCLWLKCLEILR
jgi:hypothetical protein